MTFGYPVVLDLHGVPVLVVGAGPVAVRKIAGLVAAGADVRGRRPAHRRAARTGMGSASSVSARSSRATSTGCDSSSPQPASRRSTPPSLPMPAPMAIWVNAADLPAECGFILPAIARQGPLSVAVSTDGTSPALAVRLRDRIATLLTPELATLAHDLAAERSAIKTSGGSTEDHDWSARIDAVLDAVIDQGSTPPE